MHLKGGLHSLAMELEYILYSLFISKDRFLLGVLVFNEQSIHIA